LTVATTPTAPPHPSLADPYRQVRRDYGAAVGRRPRELVTPALVLDLAATRRNIDQMAGRLRELSAAIRPHVKVHKSPELARLQVDAGAIGLSVATVAEAVVFVRSGFDHILVANTVVGAAKIQTVAELARDADVMVAVDDPGNAADLSAAATRAGSLLGVLIEVDTGMDRGGVDTSDDALALARRVGEMPGLRLLGVTGYEGHCSLTPDRAARHEKQQTAMAFLVEVAERLERAAIPCPIRSAGGTGTWEWTAAYPGITEIQAGTYVVLDNFHAPMADTFEHALTVETTVISRSPGRLIVDAGGKSIGAGDLATIVGHPYPVVRFDEEHGIFSVPDDCPLEVGDVVALVPGYAPTTVNMYDAYHVVDGDRVVDIWPVIPRGPGHHGLIATTGDNATVQEGGG
jgi:D-serine deaminase-like pyridoxal phosphate-dependent protein